MLNHRQNYLSGKDKLKKEKAKKKQTRHLRPHPTGVQCCLASGPCEFWMSQSMGAVSPTSSLRLYQQSCDPRTNKQHLGDLQFQPTTPACLHCNLSQMKPGPLPLSIIHTLCTHNMTIRPIHADAPFLDQSSQSASCKHAYC